MVTDAEKPQFSQGQSSLQQSPRTQAFLQANDENLQELATFVDFAGEKFTPCFVSVNFQDDRAVIIEALRHHPNCGDVQFVVVEVSDPNLRFLRDDLVKRLPTIEREPGKKLVLLLTGLEASIGMVGDYPPMLVDLNYVRDGFKTAVPHPMVIFLPDESLRRLAEFAPDFWAWRMAVVRFESVPDAVKSRMYQAVKRGAPTWLTVEKTAAYKALDAHARRDTIPRLLMEYESGSLSQDEDYKCFKSELMAELGISLYQDDSLEVAKDILWKSLESENFEQSTIARPKAYCYLGRIEGRQENYEKALELLNQSIDEFGKLEKSQHPDFKESLAKAIAQRGETYRLMERYSEAVVDLTQAIELDLEYKWAIASRGETYQLMKRYPEAITDYTQAIELDPEYEWAITQRGYTYQLMERYSEAVADLTQAIDLDPEYKWAIALRGYTYRLMKCYSEAVADYTRVVELDPEYKGAIAVRGYTYRLMERYSEAVADYTRAIELDPEYKGVIAQRGYTYRLMERYSEALADYTRAIELDPEYGWVIAQRGYTYRLMEHYSEALADYTRAIELDSEDKWAIASRGKTYRLMERYLEAVTDYTRAIELDPEYKWAVASRGETYQLMERYPEALTDFNHAIKLDPEYRWAIARRGYTYRGMERYPEALADFNRAIDLDPEDVWNINERGRTYLSKKDYKAALLDFEQVVELDSTYHWAIANHGLTYRLMERYPEALADYTRAIDLDPEYEWAIAKRGEVRSLTGDHTQALQDFNRSLELDANSNWTLYFRSLTYRAIHQTENAKADIEQAIKLAQQDYEAKPLDHGNILNLAIYHLTAGDVGQAKYLYQDALEKVSSAKLIKEAIRDLGDLLTVLPNFPDAQDLCRYLESALSRRPDHPA